MFINHEHKFIFIHIPKNAGTSIRNSFEIEGYDKKVVKKNWPHDTCLEIKDYCGEEVWNEYFKFAFVRNPYDRLVSYYHFHKSPQYRHPSRANKGTFKWWLRKGIDSNIKKTQSSYLNSEIEYVGRYEDLQDDFNIVCANIGIEPYILPKWNVSTHEHWEYYFDKKMKEQVYDLFQEDFQRFDFPI